MGQYRKYLENVTVTALNISGRVSDWTMQKCTLQIY